MSAFASWEARCEDIRRARPPLSWQLIHETARMIDTGRLGVCVQCGQPTVPDEFALGDGAGVRCGDVLGCWERRHPRQECPRPDTDYEISDEEFEAAKAYLIAKHGEIPPSLQRVIDRGGRFKREGNP